MKLDVGKLLSVLSLVLSLGATIAANAAGKRSTEETLAKLVDEKLGSK